MDPGCAVWAVHSAHKRASRHIIANRHQGLYYAKIEIPFRSQQGAKGWNSFSILRDLQSVDHSEPVTQLIHLAIYSSEV